VFVDYFESSSITDIEKLYKNEADPIIKTKLLAILYRKEKRKISDISDNLRISVSTLRRAIIKFRENGRDGLVKGHGGGNPGYLSESEKEALIKFIEENTPTSTKINTFIKDNFGESYHPFSIPRLMKSLNFSRITPRKKHYKSDKSKQEEWKQVFKKKQKNTWIWVIESSSKMKQ
jgi:transposase